MRSNDFVIEAIGIFLVVVVVVAAIAPKIGARNTALLGCVFCLATTAISASKN